MKSEIISMKSKGLIKKLALCILLLQVVHGYPARTEKQVESEEKQLPNGTVVGKYAYLDKEGNPVQVKYYADDSSYGVELNSYKVVHNDGAAKLQTEKQANKFDEVPNMFLKQSSTDAVPKDGAFDTIDTFKYPTALPSANKYNGIKSEYPEYINKAPLRGKNIYQKNKYSSPDFEIYSKDELDNAQCGAKNEKVHVYNFVKEARNIHEVPFEEEAQFCA